MSLKILATADIHVGRRPSKIPDPEDARRFSAARVWEAIVDRAVQEKVDLVALTGDVVDHDNRFFEATGPLERGLTRLAEHGIHCYAVAGNHDYDVLPRIVDTVGSEYFHLLGRGGRWEEAIFPGDGDRRLRIHGWSFPKSHVPTSPLAQYDLTADGDVPTIGLLHADLDVPGSPYGPVTRAELDAQPITLWLLGHVHRAEYHEAGSGPAVLYPGSPQAMDPGETGPHGPWLIEVHSARRVEATRWAMSKVYYDEVAVDLTDVQTNEEFQRVLSDRVREQLRCVAEDGGPLEYLSLRLELTGYTPLCSQLDNLIEKIVEEYHPSLGEVTAGIDKITNHTTPPIDLEELAAKHDPPGVLARTLLSLQADETGENVTDLVSAARRKAMEVHAARGYTQISADPAPDDAAVRQCLIRQGTLLLDRLLAQERSE